MNQDIYLLLLNESDQKADKDIFALCIDGEALAIDNLAKNAAQYIDERSNLPFLSIKVELLLSEFLSNIISHGHENIDEQHKKIAVKIQILPKIIRVSVFYCGAIAPTIGLSCDIDQKLEELNRNFSSINRGLYIIEALVSSQEHRELLDGITKSTFNIDIDEDVSTQNVDADIRLSETILELHENDKSNHQLLSDENKQRLIELQSELSRRRKNKFKIKIFIWEIAIRSTYFIKRLSDIVVSLIALIVLFPLFLIVALLIKLSSRGPVFYTHTRVGRNGKYFPFYKFRTMQVSADEQKVNLSTQNESSDGVIFKMKDDPRITCVGKFLRKFSIDELPQLYSVLIGEMSLVGPRPALPAEVAQYSIEERKRLNITPGLTCIWQVSGRSDIPFKKQVELDKEYIKQHGFWVDLWILLKTIPAVFSGKGAY